MPSEDLMRQKTFSYAGGLFDAEGSFTIGRSESERGVNYSARIRLNNVNRAVVKWMIEKFGGSKHRDKPKSEAHSVCYYWEITDALHARRFLKQVVPYLRIKKPQADLLAAYLDLNGVPNPPVRQKLYEEMRSLKDEIRVTTETPANSKLDFSYLAGFFDGEGTASIITFVVNGHRQYAARIYVTNTDLPMLEMYKELFGGSIRLHAKPNKQCYRWELRKNVDREKFLLYCLPYLIIKRDEANLTLQFLRLGSKIDPVTRKSLYEKLTRFKQERMIQSHLPGDEQSDTAERSCPQDECHEHEQAKTLAIALRKPDLEIGSGQSI